MTTCLAWLLGSFRQGSTTALDRRCWAWSWLGLALLPQRIRGVPCTYLFVLYATETAEMFWRNKDLLLYFFDLMLSKTLIQCTCIAAAILPAFAGTATLSNIALPRDQSGQQIITGEASAMAHDGAYYFYFNNWGECPGVNCCASPAGCATCCFTNFPNYTKGCASPTNGSDPYGILPLIF